MADHSKAFEITIAALGIIVTGLIGYGQYRLNDTQNQFIRDQKQAESDRIEAQQKADAKRYGDATELQVMSIVAPHFVNLTKPGKDFDSSWRVVESAATYLSDQHQRSGLAAMATQIARGNSEIPQEVKTRLQEATVVSAPTATATAKWFTVLDSLPADDQKGAEARANQRQAQFRSIGLNSEVQLYKTKISNNFAVVVGGPVEQSAALELASIARKNKIAGDAFAQQDKEWTLVGTAPFR